MTTADEFEPARAAWWLDDASPRPAARKAAYRGLREPGDDRSTSPATACLGYDVMLFARDPHQSQHTVPHHIATIHTAPDLGSRAAAAGCDAGHGLV